MTETGLTERGKGITPALSVLAIFAILFGDVILLTALLAGLTLLAFDLLEVRNTVKEAEKSTEIRPREIEEELTAGDELFKEIELTRLPEQGLEYECPLENADLEQTLTGGSSARLGFSYRPELSGTCSAGGIKFSTSGRLGLAEGGGELPIDLSFRVRPRVMAAAAAAAGFLAGAGGPGGGEQPMELKGAGLEYAGSRKYRPGDEVRNMDWKATARLNRPIVKEHYLEGGGGVHLVYEVAAPDPVSLDKLSTSFLNLTTALARREVPMGLTIHDGREVRVHAPRTNPKEAVALAIRHALRSVEVEVEELYAVLEPRTSREIRGILQKTGGKPLKRFLDAQLRAKSGRESPYRILEDLVRETGENIQVVLNSSLWGDVSPLLEFGGLAREKGTDVSVLQPTQPWKNCEDLEESYRIRRRYSRVHGVLEGRNFKVSGSTQELLKKLATSPAAGPRI